MRAQKKITPAILGDTTSIKSYRIDIDIGNDRWAELNFSEREMATSEFNRIKGQGIFCGAWIKEISLNEQTVSQ
jgi:hypothetical protein